MPGQFPDPEGCSRAEPAARGLDAAPLAAAIACATANESPFGR